MGGLTTAQVSIRFGSPVDSGKIGKTNGSADGFFVCRSTRFQTRRCKLRVLPLSDDHKLMRAIGTGLSIRSSCCRWWIMRRECPRRGRSGFWGFCWGRRAEG